MGVKLITLFRIRLGKSETGKSTINLFTTMHHMDLSLLMLFDQRYGRLMSLNG